MEGRKRFTVEIEIASSDCLSRYPGAVLGDVLEEIGNDLGLHYSSISGRRGNPIVNGAGEPIGYWSIDGSANRGAE